MIDTYLLNGLVAFEEYGTLSSAAEHLHISQPALSRSMQKLEDLLQVQLFDRTKNHMSLTNTGKLAAEYAKRVLREQEDMITTVRNYDRSLHTLSIGYCAPGPMYIFTNITSRLMPDMAISSAMESEDNLLKGLQNGKYQIIILSHLVKEEIYYSEKTIIEHLYASVVPANPISVYEDKGIYFKDMNGETFLMNQSVGIWDEITRRNMPDSKLLLQSNNESLGEIISASSLSSFATNITNRLYPERSHQANRINIPFLDKDAYVQFYFVTLSKNAQKYKNFFANATMDAS